MTAAELISSLDAVHGRGAGKWTAKCPAHEDRSPSLSITEGDRGLLLKCWAGCTVQEIASALGLRVSDLFYDDLLRCGKGPTPSPLRRHLAAIAFDFELGALDRRLRAEKVLNAVKGIEANTVSEDDLYKIMEAIGRASADIERAVLLEAIADDLRVKEFVQRERTCHAAA